MARRPAGRGSATLAMATVLTVAVVTSTSAQQSVPVLTLGQAIAEALERSPELQPGEDALARAAIRERTAAAAFAVKIAPELGTTTDPVGGEVRTAGVHLSRQLTTGGQLFFSATSQQYANPIWNGRDSGFSAGFSQPLLRGLTRSGAEDLTAAKRAVIASNRERAVARAALVVRVVRQYAAAAKQDRLAEIAREALGRARTLRDASEARTRAGLATDMDVLRARMLESQTTAALSEAVTAAAAARDQLLVLIGRTIGAVAIAPVDLATLEAGLAPIVTASSADDEEIIALLVADALGRRVELDEARDRVTDARRTASVAAWNQLPPVSLDVMYTRRGVGAPAGSVFAALPGGWRVSLSSAYTVDRASQQAAAETSRLTVAAAEHAVRDAEQRVTLEVRQAWRAWRASESLAAIGRDAEAIARREQEVAQVRCDRGLATSLEVVDAHLSLLRAQQAVASAELDRFVHALDLRRATGLLDVEHLWR